MTLIEAYISNQTPEQTNIGCLILKSKKSDYPKYHFLYKFEATPKQNSIEKASIQYIPLIKYIDSKTHYILPAAKPKYPEKSNFFQMSINHIYKTSVISSTGSGFLILPEEARGFGLGTYAFYRLIHWAKEKNFADYAVRKQPIGGKEFDHTPRFHLYIKSGLSLNAEAVKTEGRSGEYFANAIHNMTPYVPKNIEKDLSLKKYMIYLNDTKLMEPLYHFFSNKQKSSIWSKLFKRYN